MKKRYNNKWSICDISLFHNPYSVIIQYDKKMASKISAVIILTSLLTTIPLLYWSLSCY